MGKKKRKKKNGGGGGGGRAGGAAGGARGGAGAAAGQGHERNSSAQEKMDAMLGRSGGVSGSSSGGGGGGSDGAAAVPARVANDGKDDPAEVASPTKSSSARVAETAVVVAEAVGEAEIEVDLVVGRQSSSDTSDEILLGWDDKPAPLSDGGTAGEGAGKGAPPKVEEESPRPRLGSLDPFSARNARGDSAASRQDSTTTSFVLDNTWLDSVGDGDGNSLDSDQAKVQSEGPGPTKTRARPRPDPDSRPDQVKAHRLLGEGAQPGLRRISSHAMSAAYTHSHRGGALTLRIPGWRETERSQGDGTKASPSTVTFYRVALTWKLTQVTSRLSVESMAMKNRTKEDVVEWEVSQRYSAFENLHKLVKAEMGSRAPEFPSKARAVLFKDDAFIEERRRKLET